MTTSIGLTNVTVANTALSSIDGTAGRLQYAGYDIHELAQSATFEDICYLLWYGDLPNAMQLRNFKARLIGERRLSEAEQQLVERLPHDGHGMDALRTMVSALAQLDPQADDTQAHHVDNISIRLVAKIPTLLATWHRIRRGQTPIDPDPELGHAANFLWMLHGERPSDAATRAFEVYLVLTAEHGLNASTFAARVAIGSHADAYCAVVAAIGTLKGLWHGGANQKAMETFIDIGAPENAPAYINSLIAQGGRLMGVGHRIYKVEDPRVRHLRTQVEALGSDQDRWQLVADAVRDIIATHPYFTKRQLAPNVEFYSAPLLYELGLPLDLFTAAFAMSRSAGWIAHIREQLVDNRLIRPKAAYNGPENRKFVALQER
ncbi:MAG: citrate/2-methylcitrate synthase [Chloroflexota bacterium]